MLDVVILEDERRVKIPSSIANLEDFRRWARSDAFPEKGRIDFLVGCVEVDMSAEDLFCHGAIKVEVVTVLNIRVKRAKMGHLFTDRTRVSSIVSDLSTEPDVLFVSHTAIESGELRLVEKAGETDRFVEIEGPADLIVEIVSDSSVSKDRRRLPRAYYRAGVKEYWLIDGRGRQLYFQIFTRGNKRFEPVEIDGDGFQFSSVMGCAYRLDRTKPTHGLWEFDLIERPAS